MKVSKLLTVLVLLPTVSFADIDDQCSQLSYQYSENQRNIESVELQLKNKYPIYYPFMESCSRESDVGACFMGKCLGSALFETLLYGENANVTCDDFIADAIRAENIQKTAFSNMQNLSDQYDALSCGSRSAK